MVPSRKRRTYGDDVDIIRKLEKENVNLRLRNYLLHNEKNPPSPNTQARRSDAIRQFYHFDDDDIQMDDPLIECPGASPSELTSKKMVDLESKLQELELRYRELQDDNIALETKVEVLVSRSRDDAVTMKKLLQENNVLEMKLHALERHSHDDAIAMNKLEEKNNALEAKVDNLESAEAALIRESYLLAEDIESKNEIISMLREEKVALVKVGTREKEKYETQLQVFKNENSELGQAIGKMEQKIDVHTLRQVEIEVESTKYKNENLALKCDLERLRRLKVENETQTAALKVEVDKLAYQTLQQKCDLSQAKEELEESVKSRTEDLTHFSGVVKENDALVSSIAELETSNEKLRKENAQLKRVPVSYVLSEQLASKYDALERDNKRLSMDNAVLLRQTEYSSKAVTELQSRLKAAVSISGRNEDLLLNAKPSTLSCGY